MKIFVEYSIREECRQAYLIFMNMMIETNVGIELYEGTDQPGLFVEVWNHCTYQEYETLKSERIHNISSKWSELNSYIQGGEKKLHMWHFTKKTVRENHSNS